MMAPGGAPPMPPNWGGAPGAPPMPQQQPQQFQPQPQQPQTSLGVEELKNLVLQLGQQVRALSRKVDMIAAVETLNNRAFYGQQAQQGTDPWSIELRLQELGGPIPPQ